MLPLLTIKIVPRYVVVNNYFIFILQPLLFSLYLSTALHLPTLHIITPLDLISKVPTGILPYRTQATPVTVMWIR